MIPFPQDPTKAHTLTEFVFRAIQWLGGLCILLGILSLWPFGLIPLFPILALHVAGYRIVDGGSMNWTDDIEEYLAAKQEWDAK